LLDLLSDQRVRRGPAARRPGAGAPAIAATVEVTERTSEPPRLRVRRRVRELYAYREIILNLVRKELKVKYTASVLGAVWSVLNPIVFLAVFWFVSKVLGSGLIDYPVFLLSGLLAWNLFSVSLAAGAQSVIANANLVKKVYFPREILPLATVGVALFDFVLQSLVFTAYMIVSRYGFQLDVLWLYPIAFVALLTVTVAVTFWVSALNVRYRDVQHLIGLALLVWFWVTPIVYAAGDVYKNVVSLAHGQLLWRIFLLNPLTWIVFGFQRALYHSSDATQKLAPYSPGQLALGLGVVTLIGLGVLYLTWRVFFGMSGDFAEEL
jgi:ABC-2 type transport system permease protein